MSALPAVVVGPVFEPGELLAHVERQLESSRRLLQAVLAQSEAIRGQDVAGVLEKLREIQAEMTERHRLESERSRLLQAAADALGVAPETLDVEAVLPLLGPGEAEAVRRASAELRGLVVEIGRTHDLNRILLRQELAFLDHLMRAISGTPQGGYTPAGPSSVPSAYAALDMRA